MTNEDYCEKCKGEVTITMTISQHDKGGVACPKCGGTQLRQLSIAKFIGPFDLYLLFVVALVKLLDQCPFLQVKKFFARVVAFMAFQLSRRRRRLKQRTVAQTLQVGEPEARNIVRHSFNDFWCDIFVDASPPGGRTNGQVCEVRGIEHLKEALQKRRGVILWESAFFGRRVLAKRILHEKAFSVCQVHSEYHIGGFHNPRTWMSTHVIQPFFNNRQRCFVKELISLSRSDSLAYTRDLLVRLKQNEIISIAADGTIGHKFISLEFLGRTNLFSTGMVSLARLSGATILPLFCVQEEGNQPTLVIDAPIRIEVDGDRERGLESAIRQYASLLEQYIKRYPKQYRNWHGLLEAQDRHP